MRINQAARHPQEVNAEGTQVLRLRPEQELARTVLSCLLWEDSFYESGEAVAERIARLVALSKPEGVAELARKARGPMKLRHVPLLLIREMARLPQHKRLVSGLLESCIQRPDEITEFLAIYWKDKRQPLSAQVKKGLAKAFGKFDEFALSRYDRAGAVKLRDALFLCHANPGGEGRYTKAERKLAPRGLSGREDLYRRLVEGKLEPVDTWETALSSGGDKKLEFERLLREDKLGALALLRNLRNMLDAGVEERMIRTGISTMKVERVLPFRFISAARYAPRLEPELEQAMFRCLEGGEKLAGHTALVIDTSPSMWQATVSSRSEMNRFDAAAALAILARELCEQTSIFAFNERAVEVPPRRGFALRDALEATRGNASCGGLAVEMANARGYDRIIVLTDGQWHYKDASKASWGGYGMGDAKVVSPAPLTSKAYMLNVATDRNGVGYGRWQSIDGWSEAVLSYIQAAEPN